MLAARDEALARGDEPAAREHGQQALSLLTFANARFPYTAVYATRAARLSLSLGDAEGALAWHQVADGRVPGTFVHNNAIGFLMLELGRPAEAADHLRAAIFAHKGKGCHPSYARLAQAYLQLGRFEEAWYIYHDLVALFAFQALDPGVLLDATATLLALKRQPDVGAILLDQYATLVPEADKEERYQRLRQRVARQAAPPRRSFERPPGM